MVMPLGLVSRSPMALYNHQNIFIYPLNPPEDPWNLKIHGIKLLSAGDLPKIREFLPTIWLI
jgi:hypothetical protein